MTPECGRPLEDGTECNLPGDHSEEDECRHEETEPQECEWPIGDGSICNLPETHEGECRHVYSAEESDDVLAALRHDLAVLEAYRNLKEGARK